MINFHYLKLLGFFALCLIMVMGFSGCGKSTSTKERGVLEKKEGVLEKDAMKADYTIKGYSVGQYCGEDGYDYDRAGTRKLILLEFNEGYQLAIHCSVQTKRVFMIVLILEDIDSAPELINSLKKQFKINNVANNVEIHGLNEGGQKNPINNDSKYYEEKHEWDLEDGMRASLIHRIYNYRYSMTFGICDEIQRKLWDKF